MGKTDILKEYRYDGSKKLDLDSVIHDSGGQGDHKEEFVYKTEENIREIDELQGRLYAQSQESVLIVLQALDAAGKDRIQKRSSTTFCGATTNGCLHAAKCACSTAPTTRKFWL